MPPRASLIVRIAAPLSLGLALGASPCAAQEPPGPRDGGRVLLLTHVFGPDSAPRAVVTMERRTVYWAEVIGPGTPAFRPQRGRRPAFVVAIARGTGAERRWFEVHAFHDEPHAVTLTDQPSGATTLLRVYHDVAETRRIAEKRERELMGGVLVAAGLHTSYRFDPTGGADPAGGSDVELCALVESGGRFATCVGLGRQSLPDAGYTATWLFLEPRARLASGEWLWARRTDVGAALRFSQGLSAGPRHLNPRLLSIGLYAVHHLSDSRRGWSVQAAWLHGRLDNTPETERLDTDRITAGVIWIP